MHRLETLSGVFRVPCSLFLFSLSCKVIPDIVLIPTLGHHVRDVLDLGSVERCHMTWQAEVWSELSIPGTSREALTPLQHHFYIHFLFIYFFRRLHCSAQGLLLALCAGITQGWRTIWDTGIETFGYMQSK